MSEGILFLKEALLSFAGLCYGLLAAAGVFTVFVAVGLIPRFAGKTHTAGHVVLYEEMVIAGTVAGGILSIFGDSWGRGTVGRSVWNMGEISLEIGRIPAAGGALRLWAGNGLLLLFGLFSGMFIGCLALAIAEMLDSIPIFARRISFRHGIGLAVLSMAAGKLMGSLLYFIKEFYHTVE